MTKTVFFALTGALLAVATPALAEAIPPAAPNLKPDTTEVKPAAKVRYCVLEEFTGSRIARKTCLTREDWLRQGFDPLAK